MLRLSVYEVEILTEEERLLVAKTEDLFALCDKYQSPRFSAFLTEEEQALLAPVIKSVLNWRFYGGYPEAGRKVLGVFPEWAEPEEADFTIKVLKITKTYGEPLTHRDYLGTILSLGVDRSKTGDILVDGQTAYVFVCSDIAAFLRENITKIANRGVSVEIMEPGQVRVPEQKFETLDVVAASLRLDAVVAAMLHMSRNAAVKLIEGGKVAVNHRPAEDGAKQVTEDDLLSVRGYGRYKVCGAGGTTRSGRLHLDIKKYI